MAEVYNSLKHIFVFKDDDSFSIEWLEVKSSFMRSFKIPNVWMRFSAPNFPHGCWSAGCLSAARWSRSTGWQEGTDVAGKMCFRLKYRLQRNAGQRLLGTMQKLLWTHQASEELGECCHLLIDATQRSASSRPQPLYTTGCGFIIFHGKTSSLIPEVSPGPRRNKQLAKWNYWPIKCTAAKNIYCAQSWD